MIPLLMGGAGASESRAIPMFFQPWPRELHSGQPLLFVFIQRSIAASISANSFMTFS